MKTRRKISSDEAKRIGDSLYVDWNQVDLEQFRQGLMGNHEQRGIDPETGLAYDRVLLSGRVVLHHMQQIPDYFVQLARLRAEVRHYEVRRSQRIEA